MSTNTMSAPTEDLAPVVAIKVFGTVTTISPGFTPAAMKANRSASVPLLTPTQCFVSQNFANSRSNSSTIRPPIKPAVWKTFSATAKSSAFNSWCGVTRSRKGIFRVPFIGLFRLLGDKPQNLCRVSGNNCVWWHILCDNAARADNSVLADRNSAKDRRSRADRGAFLDQCLFDSPVRFRLQLSTRCGRAWIRIIYKSDAMSDENVIFELNAFADERVTRNLAPPPYACILLDLHECADLCLIAYLTAV